MRPANERRRYSLCMRPANETRRHIVRSLLIGKAHTQNDRCHWPPARVRFRRYALWFCWILQFEKYALMSADFQSCDVNIFCWVSGQVVSWSEHGKDLYLTTKMPWKLIESVHGNDKAHGCLFVPTSFANQVSLLLTKFRAWINDYMHGFLWNIITHPRWTAV